MIRSWGLVTLTGSAQPWFGDVTTAAVNTVPSGGSGIIPVTVASTLRYRVEDRIYLDPETASQDMLMIDNIPVTNGTILNCRSEGGAKTHTHANGAIVQLSIACATINLQPLSANTGALFIGADNTITNVPGGSVYQQILPANPPSSNFSIGFNVVRTSDGWMAGTANDKVIVACMIA